MSTTREQNPSDWPSGFVTIVFTDIEGSTKLTNRLNQMAPRTYEEKLRDPHRERLAEFIGNKGREVQRAGDGHMWVFASPREAIACLVEFQQSLRNRPIVHQEGDEKFVVSVRVGMHTTENEVTPTFEQGWPEYPGADTNFASRVASIANGGQILLSQHTRERATHEANKHSPKAWHNRYLKDFTEDARRSEPVTVYELLYEGAPESSEPGMRFFKSFYEVERNLYVPRPEKEREVIACFKGTGLSERREQLVEIVATGGMGKTRLAVNVATQVAGAFEHGVHFVSLTFVAERTAEAVAQAIAKELGLGEAYYQPDALFQALYDRHLLLVLDNYESVASKEVGQFLASLVRQTLNMHLLVTTRQDLQVSNVQYPVSLKAGMTVEQARSLFFDRARRADPDFALEAGDEKSLDRLMHLLAVDPGAPTLGVIPLAVELTAAWIAHVQLAEIVTGLESQSLAEYQEYVQLPPGDGRDDSEITRERHDSLWNSLNWSYNLLATLPYGQRLQSTFLACSLFVDVSVEAMQAILGQSTVRNDLIILATTSLLIKEPRQGRTFYRMHRFTRDFAASQRESSPDAGALVGKFLAFYSAKVQEHKSINKQQDQIHRDWLDAERNNLFTASRLAYKTKALAPLYYIVNGLFGYFQIRGLWSEWETMANQGLEVTRLANERQIEGFMLGALGNVYQLQNKWGEAEAAYQASLTIQREFGDRVGEGTTLNNLGVVYRLQNKWAEAEAAYNQDLAICREFGDRVGEGQTLNNLGNVYHLQDKWVEAEAAYQASLTIQREFGNRVGEGQTLNNLGNVYQLLDKWVEAEAAHQASLTIQREFGDRVGEGITLNNLGVVYQLLDKWVEAEAAYQASLTIKREFGNRVGEGQTLENLALLWAQQNSFDLALPYARQAVEVLKTTQALQSLEKAQRTLNAIEQEQNLASL